MDFHRGPVYAESACTLPQVSQIALYTAGRNLDLLRCPDRLLRSPKELRNNELRSAEYSPRRYTIDV